MDFEEKGSLQLELEYAKKAPPSVLPRFIVQMHPWVVAKKAWRSGVFLNHPNWEAKALIRLDELDRRIRIWVKGKERRKLMDFVRDTLGNLNREFKDLAVEELVPLDNGVAFVSYSELVSAEEMGEEFYTSLKLKKKFMVADLLNGLEEPERRTEKHSPKVKVFISYAHKNLEKDGAIHKNNLVTHLASYTRAGEMEIWEDGCLIPGEEWKSELWKQHEAADIVLCLVNANFIESKYCYGMEFAEALKGRAAGTKDVVPILVEDCFLKKLEDMTGLQMIPSKPVAQFANANDAWAEVMRSLEPVVERWIERKRASSKRNEREFGR
jgi:internalin A